MNRRDLLKTSLFGAAAAPAFAQAGRRPSGLGCEDCFVKEIALTMPAAPRLRVTGVKTFGVTSDVLPRDRPHVFVKIETDAGVVGWGEATLEGKAGAAMQAVDDFSRRSSSARTRCTWNITGNRCTSTRSIARGRSWRRRSPASIRRCGTFVARCSDSRSMSCWAARSTPRGVRGYYHLRPPAAGHAVS